MRYIKYIIDKSYVKSMEYYFVIYIYIYNKI